MLRITRLPDGRTLKLEGKLVGPWVGELAALCSAFAPGTQLRLELSAVGFVDADGLRLLSELQSRGVEMVCMGLVAELLSREAR